MATADELKAHLAALDEPLEPLPSHHHPETIKADIESRTAVRRWLKDHLTHRLAEVTAGRPDPQDAVLAGPPKG